jgi:hypothetical protein
VRHTSSRYNENGPEHNCLLSDIEQRDLRPGLDYVHDSDNWMFAWNFLDPRCDLIAHTAEQQHRFDGHYIRELKIVSLCSRKKKKITVL